MEEQDFPTQDAIQIANNITNLGQIYNRDDISSDIPVSRNPHKLAWSSSHKSY